MKPVAYITTSWDDGFPLDLRVAELLAKYGLRGTFYVPRTAERDTITEAQVRELGSAFEVGGHTLHHVDLSRTPAQQAWHEIADCRSWLEDSTGTPCDMFCPPYGRYRAPHLELIRRAGYVGLRSVELLSVDFPRPRAGLMLMATTVQVCTHGPMSYAKNLLKRAACRNLWHYIAYGRSSDWVKVARSLLNRVLQQGGVFHLWGHSWELQETAQWQRLEEVLLLSEFTAQAPALTNGQVCQSHVEAC